MRSFDDHEADMSGSMGNKQVGKQKPELQMLPQIKERISFLYLERCVLNRQDNAICVTDTRGTVHVPSAALSVIMLGSGTKVTHRAMELMGSSGLTSRFMAMFGSR